MNPRIGTHSHPRAMARGPKHSHAMIKNEAPSPSRMPPMRASSASKCARRASRSARRCEYCSVGVTENSVAHFQPPQVQVQPILGLPAFLFLARAFAVGHRSLIGLVQIAVRAFCAAFCATSCLTASCASATMAGWPTPRASGSCPRYARYWVCRRPLLARHHRLSPKPGRPRCSA